MLHCKGNLVTKRTHQHFVWSRLVSPERLNMQVRKTFMRAPRARAGKAYKLEARTCQQGCNSKELEGTLWNSMELEGTRLDSMERTVQQHVQADKTLRN